MPARKDILSVVIASVNGLPVIDECLTALGAQTGGVEVKVVVADRCGPAVREHLKKRFPTVKVIDCPPTATVPELRAAAIDAATKDGVVAIIEDHCIAPPGWARAMLDGHASGHAVVAGPIENLSTRTAADRAAFIVEYSRYMPPVAEGPVKDAPGNNVSYSRVIIDRYRPLFATGAWDTVIHGRLSADGVELYMKSAAIIGHRLEPGFFGFAVQKFHFARSFAAKRFEGGSRAVAIACAAAALALPVVLLLRITGETRSRGERLGGLSTLLAIVVFLLFWAAGEAVGYIFGAGSSSEKVR